MRQFLINRPDSSSREYFIAGVTFATILLCLYMDSDATLQRQNQLGFCGWIVLIGLLIGENNLVRTQVVIAVIFAVVGEHFASVFMGGYTYRFDNVPAYVPPGHGMVYLTAVVLARSRFFLEFRKPITVAILATGSVWSIWGITFAERGDAVGALLFAVFFVCIFVGKSPLVYLGAFLVTTWLELIGTWLGTWYWAVLDPILDLPQGNPPSGVAAWYCMVDAFALWGAPKILRLGDRIRQGITADHRDWLSSIWLRFGPLRILRASIRMVYFIKPLAISIEEKLTISRCYVYLYQLTADSWGYLVKLTTKGRYAVTSMLDLAFHGKDQPVSLSDIAKRQAISLAYLEQLFARLRKAGLVIGVRGPGGGYQLSRDERDINIAQIIDAVDEVVDSTKCGGKSNCHNNKPCLTHDLWMGLSDRIRQYLAGITLKDVLASPKVRQVAERLERESQQTRIDVKVRSSEVRV